MKQKDRHFNPYGLCARIGMSLAVSAVICLFVFLVLNTGIGCLLADYYENSDFERIHYERQSNNLQSYINKNQISTQNLNQLKTWEKKQPIIIMELYADGQCIYSSIYDVPVSNLMLDEGLENQNSVNINLMDKQVTAYIYSDFTYQSSVIGTFASVVVTLILFVFLFFYNIRKLIRYICRLNEEVQILEGGNLEYCVSEEGNDEITDLARSLNRMRVTLQQQIETEQQLHQANRQLVTEMSHDLRTPLTGIMLYLEVLRSHRYKSEKELQDYLEKIDAKAHHMKILSDHLFEYSMQETGYKQLETQSMEDALKHAMDCMKDDLTARGFSVETDVEWKNCFVQLNQEFVHRIFENIISNIEKYAERTAAVRIESLYTDKYCGFSVMNTFSVSLAQVESNGVGIDSIRNMMKQMNGICNVEQTDTCFEISLLFPIQ